MIRKDRIVDVRQIHTLLQYSADGKFLLGPSIGFLYDYLRDRIFTLTCQPEFFKNQGFYDIDKKGLPHKIWSGIHCSMFPDCDEEALICKAEP